jgi:hypothetical protein
LGPTREWLLLLQEAGHAVIVEDLVSRRMLLFLRSTIHQAQLWRFSVHGELGVSLEHISSRRPLRKFLFEEKELGYRYSSNIYGRLSKLTTKSSGRNAPQVTIYYFEISTERDSIHRKLISFFSEGAP